MPTRIFIRVLTESSSFRVEGSQHHVGGFRWVTHTPAPAQKTEAPQPLILGEITETIENEIRSGCGCNLCTANLQLW